MEWFSVILPHLWGLGKGGYTKIPGRLKCAPGGWEMSAQLVLVDQNVAGRAFVEVGTENVFGNAGHPGTVGALLTVDGDGDLGIVRSCPATLSPIRL